MSEAQCLAEGYGRRAEATLKHWLRQADAATNGANGCLPTLRATLRSTFCEGVMTATNKHLPMRFRINTMDEFDQYVRGCCCAVQAPRRHCRVAVGALAMREPA